MVRLLLVEDNAELAENLAEILECQGHEVDVCPSAEEALTRLDTHRYGGMVTDLRLPGQSGLQLIEVLRDRADPTPIVLMTAYADSNAAQRAEKLGALAVLFKPLDMQRLFDAVQEFAHDKRKVLVVEDNTELAENVAEALSQRGFSPVVARTVAEAMNQRGLPDVALIDYRLPDGTGLEAARRLRARDPQLRVIIVSGYGPQLKRAVGEAPPDFVSKTLAKPVEMNNLMEEVQREYLARGPGAGDSGGLEMRR